MSTKEWILIIYGGYLVLLSLIAFFTYLIDKSKAKKGSMRIPEKTLLLMSICGGAFGAYPSMLIFRHKTAKEHWYFTALNILGLLIHSALLIVIAFVIQF